MNPTESTIADEAIDVATAGLDAKKAKVRELIRSRDLTRGSAICHELLIAPNVDSECYFLKALILFLAKKVKQSEEYAAIALDKNEYSSEALALLAAILARRGLIEEAVVVAGNAVKLNDNNLQALQIQAIALTRLFRLNEAQDVLRKLSVLQQNKIAVQEYTLVDENPETIFELALTIDPFKTKTRFEALLTIKEKEFSGFMQFWTAKRNEVILGLMVIAGVVLAIVYFFQESATYKYFSLLIFSVLWIAVTGHGKMSVMTNLPLFLPKRFAPFLQKRDRKLAYQSLFVFGLFVAGLGAWHINQSAIGLVGSVICSLVFVYLNGTFSSGQVQNYVIPKPKGGNASKPKVVERVALENVPYETLYSLTRSTTNMLNWVNPLMKRAKYILLFAVAWPIAFYTVRGLGLIELSHKVLVVPLMGIFYLVLLVLSLNKFLDLPLFFPREARKFIPASRKNGAYVMISLHLVMLSSVAAWMAIDNAHVLWLTASCLILIVMRMRARGIVIHNEDLRTELITYIVSKAKPAKPSE